MNMTMWGTWAKSPPSALGGGHHHLGVVWEVVAHLGHLGLEVG